MKHRFWITLGLCCAAMGMATDLFAFRGGGRGGGGISRGGGGGFSRGGGMPRGGYGGMPRGGYGGMPRGGYGGMPRAPVNRTPSFSQPSMYRPTSRPGGSYRPTQMPSRGPSMTPRPGVGTRPGAGTGISRPSQFPSPGTRPATGQRPGAGTGISRPSQLPSPGLRPGSGTRPPISPTRPGGGSWAGSRPSTLPALGAGAALGVGVADRMQRPASLPGLGDRRPLPGQLPAGERRDQLRDRLNGGTGIADRERPGQLPERNWDQIQQDWTDRRDDIRDNWQDERDDWRDQWQDWRDDHYPWYGGWYWGYAPAYWGWWDPLWDYYPAAATMGTTWWDANSLGYTFGCGDYYNPYYSDASTIDYSEPMVTVAAGDEGGQEDPGAQGPSPEVLERFDQARTVFYQGNYEEALKLVDEAAEQLPQDAVLHEFRSLVLFALGRYRESAAAIHAVLAVGPGWDWKTLVSLYPDVDTYTVQLRALEAYCNKNPKAAYAHFLLGYQRLSCGFADAALSEFRRASALQPEDSVSANLVRSLTPRDQGSGTPSPERLADQAPKPIPIDELTGTWTATGEGTSKYSMKLDKEGTFTWSFTKGTRMEEVKGVFTSEGNVLAMEPDTGGVLLAELKPSGADQLQFKMVGGAPDEAGLDFRRSKTG